MDDHYKDIVFEQNRKSKGIAYLLWLVLGWFGVHRFYAGETKTGVIQLVLTLTVIGLPIVMLWLLLDIFLIPGLINDHNRALINTLNYGDPKGFNPARHEALGPPETPDPVLDAKRQRMLEELRAMGKSKERRDLSSLYR